MQASLCKLTAAHLTLMYVYTHIRLSEPLVVGLLKQADRKKILNIYTLPNMWRTPGIEPVTTGLASVNSASALPSEPFHHNGLVPVSGLNVPASHSVLAEESEQAKPAGHVAHSVLPAGV